MLRDISPPITGLHVRSPRRIERIENTTTLLRSLAAHQKERFAPAVVDEAVADSCAGGKCGQVTCDHVVQISIDPCVNCSFNHVDELFLLFLRVPPRRTPARRKTLQGDSDPNETGRL